MEVASCVSLPSAFGPPAGYLSSMTVASAIMKHCELHKAFTKYWCSRITRHDIAASLRNVLCNERLKHLSDEEGGEGDEENDDNRYGDHDHAVSASSAG